MASQASPALRTPSPWVPRAGLRGMQRLCHRLNLAPLQQGTIPGGGEMLEARPREAFCLIKGCSTGGTSSAGPLRAGTRAGEVRMGLLLPPPLPPVTATKLTPPWGLLPPRHSSSGCPGRGRGWGSRAPHAPWHTGLPSSPPPRSCPMHAAACPSTTIIASGLKYQALSLLGRTLGIVCS